jgi:hypothetical protein
MVEKESGKYIKVLRLDRVDEYMLTDFMEFCQSHGIKRNYYSLYSIVEWSS